LGKNFENMSALEIGCGVGRILIPMSKKFHKVVGVDISNEMIKIGKQKTEKHPNCEFLVNNGKDLTDLPSNFFNFCYSFIVFQHIPDKDIVKNYIKDIHRILKTNSCFCFQVKGIYEIDPIKFRLLDKIKDKESLTHNTWFGVQFSSKEMHKIADEFGFKVIEESGENTEYYWLTFVKK
jgi:ubiquinone/menaquinone biosynthesis C-methylase UbiE